MFNNNRSDAKTIQAARKLAKNAPGATRDAAEFGRAERAQMPLELQGVRGAEHREIRERTLRQTGWGRSWRYDRAK